MARLLLVLKSTYPSIITLFDALKAEFFQKLSTATKIISGYDENTKNFRAPSLALHMESNLKMICDVAFKLVIEKRNLPKIQWDDRDDKKREIKDLKKLVEGHWCNEISSLALKDLKEKHWEKPKTLPLTTDIQQFQSHVSKVADDAYEKLQNNIDIISNYRKLTECILAWTIMFNRKRIGDVQYLKVETYNNSGANNIDQEPFVDSLTHCEQILSKKFKRVVTGGKGSRPVPILFSQKMQKFISCILKTRENSNVEPTSNPYLFTNPGSEHRWMADVNVMRKLAKDCGAQNAALLTSTKFRKHIATTLQLMTMESNEMEQIATFMGHTKDSRRIL
jgi:hypothetical protein